ncbi:RNA-binding motif protein X-linked 2 [Anopheles sinensis]|uniref:RNA-binding motif protein X-linked 2 n=1 Tax=Anopheles sinensis TaxID=74873 RepID=A0A084W5G9_ANOSI|nr:RNA-binding motif protein X-linked 2 [Anopheles sinensis]
MDKPQTVHMARLGLENARFFDALQQSAFAPPRETGARVQCLHKLIAMQILPPWQRAAAMATIFLSPIPTHRVPRQLPGSRDRSTRRCHACCSGTAEAAASCQST